MRGEPRQLPFRTEAERRRVLPDVARHLGEDGLVAYPTETVYGFGCALRPRPLRRLMRLKRSGSEKPFVVLVRGASDASELMWSDAARALARAFWPGPLTLVLPVPPHATLAGAPPPPEVLGPGGGIALRASPHPGSGAVVEAAGGAVTSTSANVPGDPPASDAAGVLRAVKELADGEAADAFLVLDAGVLPESSPSTIVDCGSRRPRVLRAGAISIEELRRVTPDIHE